VEKANKGMGNKKVTGDDDVPGHILKLLGEDGHKIMKQLINNIYETGGWLKDITKVKMTAFKKKPEATKCIDHHTISLLKGTAKMVMRLLRRRIERKFEDVLGEDQFGFRG
jgi:hypothetical protein